MADLTLAVVSPPPTTGRPRVSVVIAVLNGAENIRAVAEEVIEKLSAVSPIEIIFVDDGSTDATADQVRDIAANACRVRLIRYDRRCGKSQAIRTGVLLEGELDGDAGR